MGGMTDGWGSDLRPISVVSQTHFLKQYPSRFIVTVAITIYKSSIPVARRMLTVIKGYDAKVCLWIMRVKEENRMAIIQ